MFPDYSIHLGSNEELIEFMGKNTDNKLLIFSRQDYTKKITKNLAAVYHNKMDIGFVDCTEIDDNTQAIMDKYEILEFPTIIIVKDFSKNNVEVVQYNNFMNFGMIKEFLELNLNPKSTEEQEEDLEDDEEEEDSIEDEDDVILIDDQNYEFYIFQENKAVILHITNGEEKFHLWKSTREGYHSEVVYAEINCEDMVNEYLCERIF